MSTSSNRPAPNTDPATLFTLHLDWRRWWTIIPEMIVLACTGALPLIMIANVTARYTNWFHVFWAEDVVKVLFLWIVFLGGALAVKYDAHVRMSNLSDWLAQRSRAGALWDQAIRLSPLAVGGILFFLGLRVVEISMRRELPNLEISAGYFATVIPASGLLIIAFVAIGFFKRRRR